MSKFAVGDKVEVDFPESRYNGVTGDAVGVLAEHDTGTVYLLDLDVGGRLQAADADLVKPGTRDAGVYTYRVEYR